MKWTLWSMLVFAVAAAGCDKKPTPEAGSRTSVESSSPASAALATYESLRAKLAHDQSAGVAELAGTLGEQASAAARKSSGNPQTALESLASAAHGLHGKAGDLKEARKAFGEVSRHVVALLAAEPKLREGRFVFECPMAEGYKKWVQTKNAVENPYMGTRMLECGSPSDWSS